MKNKTHNTFNKVTLQGVIEYISSYIETQKASEQDRLAKEQILFFEAAVKYLNKYQVSNGWFITDDDSFQCCKALGDRFELIQINRYETDSNNTYTISRGVISIPSYSIGEIVQYLKFFGYESLEDFCSKCGNQMDQQLIAEMIFETKFKAYELADTYFDLESAAEVVGKMTALPVRGIL